MHSRPDRSAPMSVKHWSFAGLMLTPRCDAACASCYLACGPASAGPEMTVARGLEIWRQLIEASPHGCRVHLSGGEPFLDWPRLIELCRAARAQGLGPLQKVETNASWAVDDGLVRDRVRQLDEAGMETLGISADPYHQQYVPIEQPRRLARLADELLGERRVQVRWRDWLTQGHDTSEMDEPSRRALHLEYARGGRDRLNGRAAVLLAPLLPLSPPSRWEGANCREALLRSRHVHIDGDGVVTPGTCAGIALGRLSETMSVRQLWDEVAATHAARGVLGTLASAGPAGLMELGKASGFTPAEGYASRCHLCWSVRAHFRSKGLFCEELVPASPYRT